MNIFEMAIELEENSEKFYRELAQEAASSELKVMFNMLADNEISHKMIFRDLGEKVFTQTKDSSIVPDSESIFNSLAREEFASEKNRINVYRKALEMEHKSIEYYRELLTLIDDLDNAAAIERIILEEEKHIRLFESIINYLSGPDNQVR